MAGRAGVPLEEQRTEEEWRVWETQVRLWWLVKKGGVRGVRGGMGRISRRLGLVDLGVSSVVLGAEAGVDWLSVIDWMVDWFRSNLFAARTFFFVLFRFSAFFCLVFCSSKIILSPPEKWLDQSDQPIEISSTFSPPSYIAPAVLYRISRSASTYDLHLSTQIYIPVLVGYDSQHVAGWDRRMISWYPYEKVKASRVGSIFFTPDADRFRFVYIQTLTKWPKARKSTHCKIIYSSRSRLTVSARSCVVLGLVWQFGFLPPLYFPPSSQEKWLMSCVWSATLRHIHTYSSILYYAFDTTQPLLLLSSH